MRIFKRRKHYKVDVYINGKIVYAAVNRAEITVDEKGTTIFIPDILQQLTAPTDKKVQRSSHD